MNKSIRFRAKSCGRNIYHSGIQRYSAVTERATRASKEAHRKRFSLPKKEKVRPLNEIVLGRISSKAHTFQCHSPEPIKMRHKAMWMLWSKKFRRIGRSAAYHNKYSLHRFL